MIVARPGSKWQNWARNAGCVPARLLAPRGEEEIAAAVRSAAERGLCVRPAGAGHSFTPIACTEGVLLDLTRHCGVEHVDPAARTATFRAGTRVADAAQVLEQHGLALVGHGTASRNTLAGAVSTGTHGGSLVHPSFGANVVEVRLVTADGQVRVCSEARDADVLACARTSLGALGVISSVVLRCVPAHRLRAVERYEAFDAAVERIPGWAGEAEHVSMLWFPWSDRVVTRALDRTDEPATPASRWETFRDEWLRGWAARAAADRIGALRPTWVRQLAGPLTPAPAVGRVATAYAAQTFNQPVRLTAMEYALPLEGLAEILRALRTELRRVGYFPVLPVEIRPGPADGIPLSPATDRPTGWVSLIAPCGPRGAPWLGAAEQVLLAGGGRPHWGKEHSCTAADLASRYPRWKEFQAVRARLDSTGVFRNSYLDRVLGAVAAG